MSGDGARAVAMSADPGTSSAAPRAVPPRWLFHAAVAAAALPLLWAVSVPGVSFLLYLASLLLWLALGAFWLGWLVFYVYRRHALSWWFAVAPVMVVVVVALVLTGLPLTVRWAMSRSSFDAAVAQLPSGQDYSDRRERIGWYTVTGWERHPAGVVFSDSHGSFMDNAGFAYLPDGPTPELEDGGFEGPSYRSLGDGWYAWTASW